MREAQSRFIPSQAGRTLGHLTGGLLITALTCFAGAALAQEENVAFEAKPQTFSDFVEVNIINVDVSVTDKDGLPITGLVLEDFELLEDGEPVSISNFYAVQNGARLVSPAPEDEASPTPATPAPAVTEEPELEPNYLAILFDNSQVEGRNRDRLIKELEGFLKRQGQGSLQIMVASLGTDYNVLQGFTNDSRDLRRSLDQLRTIPATRGRNEAGLRVFIRTFETQDIAGPGATSRLEASARRSGIEIDRLAAEEANRVQSSLGAMEYLMTTMAGLPGRKSVLYVSDGLPLRPGQSLYHMLYNRYSYRSEEYDTPLVERPEVASLKYDLTPRFEKLVAFGQANQVALFAIDAAGQRAPYAGGAGSGRGDINSFDSGGGNPVWDQRLDILRTQNLQEGLRLAADETGGEVFANTRAYEAFLDQIRSRLDNYYSIGYAVTASDKTGRRKLEVRVTNPDLEVHHLEGVVFKNNATKLTDAVIAELLHGEGANTLALAVESDKARKNGKTRIVPIRISVPLAALTFLPEGESFAGSATVVLMTSDAPGSTSPPQRIPLSLSLTADEYPPAPERRAEALVEIEVRPGEQVLGVALRDEFGQVTASTRHDFTAR